MSANDEAREAWDGPLFEKFLRLRSVVVDGLAQFGHAMLERFPPAPSDRVLDIGCGFGDSTAELARRVPQGSAVGIDIAPRFIESATREYGHLGNVRYEARDAMLDPLGGPYDRAFSRFGTMFFASPVAALRNIHGAMRPGGLFTFCVWRKREDNDCMYRAERVARELIVMPEEKSGPTCGPGPFSMQSTDLVSDQLMAAGFKHIAFERVDGSFLIGKDIEEALDFATALGPAGEIMRLGEHAEEKKPLVVDALRRTFREMTASDGVRGPASVWLISARA